MNIGQCSICLGNFTALDIAVLRGCMHTFHRDCIGHALRIRRQCPLCRADTSLSAIATPLINADGRPSSTKNLTKEAFDIALGYYDKIVVRSAPEPGPNCEAGQSSCGGGAGADQREQLHACLQALLSTIEDRQLEKEEQWDKLLAYIKVASIAAICAILAFLCFLYWPVIAPFAGRLASTIWSLITRLGAFLRSHQAELVTAIFGLMGFYLDSKMAAEEEEAREVAPSRSSGIVADYEDDDGIEAE